MKCAWCDRDGLELVEVPVQEDLTIEHVCAECLRQEERIIYTVDVRRKGYPVLYTYRNGLPTILTFQGPFDDPAESCEEFEVCVVANRPSEYIDIETFNSRYAEYVRLKPFKPYRASSWFQGCWRSFRYRWYWRLRGWSEQHNPYARIRDLEESQSHLTHLLNHASCVCGKCLDYDNSEGLFIVCARCQRLIASNWPHCCDVFLSEVIWCKPCVAEAARKAGILPYAEMDIDEIAEFVENDLPYDVFLHITESEVA